MASYSYKSWETINLPVVSESTYFRILDHQAEHPETETSGVIYDGFIISGYYIQNLNEILSQYVKPYELYFISSLQPDSATERTFYIYYTRNGWNTTTMDDITISYDWSYKNSTSDVLSDPIYDLVDVRQYLLYSFHPIELPYTFLVRIGGNLVVDSYNLEYAMNYNYVKKLSDIAQFSGQFSLAYSYSFFVGATDSLPLEETADLYVGGRKYTMAHTCYRYCLYYLNQNGGWDSLLFSGKVMQQDNLSRLSYKKNYIAGSWDFNKVDYLTTIQEGWQLTTSFLDDQHSDKMINLFASNRIFLHDLDEDKIIPVNMVTQKCEHKTYKNQGRQLYTYTVEVNSSQPKYRI